MRQKRTVIRLLALLTAFALLSCALAACRADREVHYIPIRVAYLTNSTVTEMSFYRWSKNRLDCYSDKTLSARYEFDENGNEISSEYYNDDGDLIYRKEYEYDQEEKLIKTMTYNDNGDMTGRAVYEYDEAGHLRRKTNYDSDGDTFHQEISEYDEAGNRIKVMNYHRGSLERTNEYEYDERGNITQWRYYFDGALSIWGENAYDAAGNLTEEKEYQTDGLIRHLEYMYDDEGKEVCHLEYDNEGDIMIRSETVYSENTARRTDYDADGNMRYANEYVYNQAGNVLTKKIYGSDGIAFSHEEYTYTRATEAQYQFLIKNFNYFN